MPGSGGWARVLPAQPGPSSKSATTSNRTIVSPSSVRRDRYDKKELYARFGVKEYWIGDPANKTLEVLTLKEGRYELHCCIEEKGKLTSLVLAGLELDLPEIQ